MSEKAKDRIALALVVACIVGIYFLMQNAFSQSLIGGQPSRWMTQQQIDACASLFSTKAAEPDEITCGDLLQLLDSECRNEKPTKLVANPWKAPKQP